MIKKTSLLLPLLLMFISCQTTARPDPENLEKGVWYGFLHDEAVFNSAKLMLQSEFVPEEDLNLWENLIEGYRGNMNRFEERDWIEGGTNEFRGLSFLSISPYSNCRISFYVLIHSLMQVDVCMRSTNAAPHLGRELEKLSEIIPDLSEDEKTTYLSLFAPINFAKSDDTDTMFTNVIKTYSLWWQKDGLSFPGNSNMKVMQAIVVYPEWGLAFCDHAGLYLERESGYYLIEKKSPADPFQLTHFRSTDEMGLYLERPFLDWGDRIGLMILLNEEVVWTDIIDG